MANEALAREQANGKTITEIAADPPFILPEGWRIKEDDNV
jgi:hypothetical protein